MTTATETVDPDIAYHPSRLPAQSPSADGTLVIFVISCLTTIVRGVAVRKLRSVMRDVRL